MNFGDFFKSKRLIQNDSLRKFSSENGYDAGYISKLENGTMPPPQDMEKLEHLAQIIGVKKDSESYLKFLDLAFVSNRTFDFSKISDQKILEKLPSLFRSLENKEISEDKLEKLIASLATP